MNNYENLAQKPKNSLKRPSGMTLFKTVILIQRISFVCAIQIQTGIITISL